jgi:hypothetical protein
LVWSSVRLEIDGGGARTDLGEGFYVITGSGDGIAAW